MSEYQLRFKWNILFWFTKFSILNLSNRNLVFNKFFKSGIIKFSFNQSDVYGNKVILVLNTFNANGILMPCLQCLTKILIITWIEDYMFLYYLSSERTHWGLTKINSSTHSQALCCNEDQLRYDRDILGGKTIFINIYVFVK